MENTTQQQQTQQQLDSLEVEGSESLIQGSGVSGDGGGDVKKEASASGLSTAEGFEGLLGTEEDMKVGATMSTTAKKVVPQPSFSSPTKSCVRRIQSDLKSMFKEPIDGILAIPDQKRVNVVHALITGPVDTPYEYGFFLFKMEFPDTYPHIPPHVTLMTTGGGSVRFNPNLYADGKVCLSILGTWSGPSWSPVNTVSSVLLSIQSLMNYYPYQNEPGFSEEPITAKHVREYNLYLRYQTLRVAVWGMVEESHTALLSPGNPNVPPFASLVRDIFLDMVETLKWHCDEYAFLDGTGCPSVPKYFCGRAGNNFKFDFAGLRNRIQHLERTIRDKI